MEKIKTLPEIDVKIYHFLAKKGKQGFCRDFFERIKNII